MRSAAGWLLVAGIAAHVLTLGWGLTAGATVPVLAVRGGLVAVVLTGATVFLLIFLRMEQLEKRPVSIWLRLSVLALATASVLLMAVSHLRIEHATTAEEILEAGWLAAHWAGALLAFATSVGTEAAMAGLAWVWPMLPRVGGSESAAPLDWQRITAESGADWQPIGSQPSHGSEAASVGSQSTSQRQPTRQPIGSQSSHGSEAAAIGSQSTTETAPAKEISIEPNGSGGFRVSCACGWHRDKDTHRAAVQSGNAHTKCLEG